MPDTADETLLRDQHGGRSFPWSVPLDAQRQERWRALAAEHQETIESLRTQLHGPQPLSCDFDTRAERLVDILRGAVEPDTRGQRIARALDDAMIARSQVELFDVLGAPRALRRLEMSLLDGLNRGRSGAYERWQGFVQHILEDQPDPGHVYDLCAGFGGFCRYMATHWQGDQRPRLTASDIDPDYVAWGRELAAKDGLDVHFETRDATNLEGIEHPVSLFVCTHAIHHLVPGQALRTMAAALELAPQGILLIDIFRCPETFWQHLVAISTRFPYQPLLPDALASVRRSYTVAELAALADIAGATSITTGVENSGKLVIHARRDH